MASVKEHVWDESGKEQQETPRPVVFLGDLVEHLILSTTWTPEVVLHVPASRVREYYSMEVYAHSRRRPADVWFVLKCRHLVAI
ncbi:MAG: hypothetical protein AMXMBFR84_00290 [Candidatus Hydrogenedentota bacterium]